MVVMPNVKNVLARSLLMNAHEDSERIRRSNIQGIQNPLKRLACLALHEAALKYPGLVSAYIGIEAAAVSQRGYIGAGSDSLVMRSADGEVLKVHAASIGLSPKAKQEMAQTRQQQHNEMAAYLGTFTMQQKTFVGLHPFSATASVVQTKQPYREHYDPALFHGKDSEPDMAALDSLAQSFPMAHSGISDFVKRSFEFYDATGLVPDMCGEDNLVVSTDNNMLVLLDGQPLTRALIPVQRAALNQLEKLGDAVS